MWFLGEADSKHRKRMSKGPQLGACLESSSDSEEDKMGLR